MAQDLHTELIYLQLLYDINYESQDLQPGLTAAMLEHDVLMPDCWQMAWLSRTLPSLQLYTTVTSYVLSITIIGLGLGGFIAIWWSTKKIIDYPTNRPSIFNSMNKKVLIVTRGHFFVASIYILHAFLVTIVDALTCFFARRNDVETDGHAWNAQLLTEAAIYCFYLLAVLAAAFILVPLLQLLLVTWLLAQVSRKTTRNTITVLIPEARFVSTHVAQLWCMMCFFVVWWWTPAAEDSSLWRYVALQVCLGSSVAWLGASFVLNFRFDRLADKEFRLSTAGVKETVGMFGQTMKSVHSKAGEIVSLPQYEVVGETRPLMKKERRTPLRAVARN